MPRQPFVFALPPPTPCLHHWQPTSPSFPPPQVMPISTALCTLTHTHARAPRPTAQAIEMDSQNHVYFANRSVARLRLGDHKGSLADADAALRINSKYTKAYGFRGAALEALGAVLAWCGQTIRGGGRGGLAWCWARFRSLVQEFQHVGHSPRRRSPPCTLCHPSTAMLILLVIERGGGTHALTGPGVSR
jgi:hypothetical protein